MRKISQKKMTHLDKSFFTMTYSMDKFCETTESSDVIYDD